MFYTTNFFSLGGLGIPSIPVNISDIQDPVFVSAYTGTQLGGHPTFSTPTDDPTGQNPTFHGGIWNGGNIIVCHQNMMRW